MLLQYRGASYQTQASAFNLLDTQLIGKYRGHNCYRAIYDTPNLSLAHNLMYRGVAYGPEVAVATPQVRQLENTFKIHVPDHQKPVRSSRHHVMSDLDQVHNKFLLQKLEQRISSARQKGDQQLINMLEVEKQNLG